MQVEQGKYGATKDVYFELFEVDGVDLRTDWTPTASDCQISTDGGAYSNSDNIAVVAPTGSGTYKVVLSASEMTGKITKIKLVDAATKVFLDKVIKVETYGNASAMHPFDLGTTSTAQTADHTAGIAAVPTAVENRQEMDSNSTQLAAIVEDTGTSLPSDIAALPTAVENRQEMDSNSTQLTAIVEDTGTSLPSDIAALPTAVENRTEMDNNSTGLAAIETDTQDIQTKIGTIPALDGAGQTIGAAIGKLAEKRFGPALAKARELIAEVISTFNKTGTIAQGALAELSKMLGSAGAEIAKLIRLQLQYNKALKDLEAIRAGKKV